MDLHKEVTELMGKKVKYCRAKANDEGKPTLFKGEGLVVGVIIGATRRIQIMVKDLTEEKNTAISLDLMCINPTEAEAQEYFSHHKKLKAIVEDHNKAQQEREKEKIKEVDDFNYAFFGQPLDI